MMRRALLPAMVVACVGLGSASADVVTTKDGLVLEGTVTREKDGAVTVVTAGGEVRLAAAEVVSAEAQSLAQLAAALRQSVGNFDVSRGPGGTGASG